MVVKVIAITRKSRETTYFVPFGMFLCKKIATRVKVNSGVSNV